MPAFEIHALVPRGHRHVEEKIVIDDATGPQHAVDQLRADPDHAQTIIRGCYVMQDDARSQNQLPVSLPTDRPSRVAWESVSEPTNWPAIEGADADPGDADPEEDNEGEDMPPPKRMPRTRQRTA